MNTWYQLIGLLPFEWAHYVFMKNALLAVLLISPLFALLGCMVIHNQMAFFSEALGHAALTGIAIGVLLGVADPLWSMTVFAVLLALAVSAFRRYSAASTDTIIGLVMSFTVALGVVLLSRGGGFAKYSHYLIGDILTITPAEITRLMAVLVGVLILWLLFFNRLFMASISRSLAGSRGISVGWVEAMFSVIVAIVVTVSIPWIGLLVINSMLVLPAAASRNLASNTPRYILGAVLISLVSGVGGLLCSYYWGTATGATIVLFAMGFFLLSFIPRFRGSR